MRRMRGWMALPVLMCAGAAAAQGVKPAGASLGFSHQDGKLAVVLVDTLCDACDSCIGTLRAGRFSGAHVQYGWGSRTVGQVSGVFIAKQ